MSLFSTFPKKNTNKKTLREGISAMYGSITMGQRINRSPCSLPITRQILE